MTAQHGTAVSRCGCGVLILGASGSGKSGLAMQLIALGADLVADDAVRLEQNSDGILLVCPSNIRGMIEVRGVGLLTVNSVEKAKLAIVVDLNKSALVRMPDPKTAVVSGHEFPLIPGKNCPNLASVVWCLLGGGRILPTVCN